jgi:phosphate starvation-inducible PhoH-like protein
MGKSKAKQTNTDYWGGIESDDDLYASSYSSSVHIPNQSIYIKNSFKDKESLRVLPQIKPKNAKQSEFLQLLENPEPPIVIATGPAGCGKTHLASLVGLKKLHEGSVQKLIITRPAVSVDEDHGFLPGTLEEKMDPWMRPIYDSFYHFYSPKKIQSLLDDKVIEICPLAYARGRTFENAWIIGDEAQNCTVTQLMMLLTRIGKNSKLVITGDLAQSDLIGVSGLSDLVKRLEKYGVNMPDIQKLHFSENDVERHPVIKNVLRLYKSQL